MGWREHSKRVKVLAEQALPPGFDPQNPHKCRRESGLQNCLLTFTLALRHPALCLLHIYNNNNKLELFLKWVGNVDHCYKYMLSL